MHDMARAVPKVEFLDEVEVVCFQSVGRFRIRRVGDALLKLAAVSRKWWFSTTSQAVLN
jgi:hypothetical protein